MTVPLTSAEVAALQAAPLTYAEVGATAEVDAGRGPRGYRASGAVRRVEGLDLRSAAERLLGWRVHEAAGLTVAVSSARVVDGAVVRLSLGRGRLRVQAPCRVVAVVEEPGRVGFAYGTLPGHPESGEQRFLLEQQDDGSLTFSITAFSRPAGLLARAGGPVTRRLQDAMAARYLAALR
jgi:uncharacterized protein (UPF0548 family)